MSDVLTSQVVVFGEKERATIEEYVKYVPSSGQPDPPAHLTAAVGRIINLHDKHGLDHPTRTNSLLSRWNACDDEFGARKAVLQRALNGGCTALTRPAWKFDLLKVRIDLESRRSRELWLGVAAGLLGIVLLAGCGYWFWTTATLNVSDAGGLQRIVLCVLVFLVVVRVVIALGRHALDRFQVSRALDERRRDLLAADVALEAAPTWLHEQLGAELVQKLLRPSSLDR